MQKIACSVLPTLLFLLFSSAAHLGAQPQSIFPQGNFAEAAPGDLPAEWTGHRAAHLERVGGFHGVVEENDERFLRLSKVEEASSLRVTSRVPLPPRMGRITLVANMRPYEIQPGSENPHRNNFRLGLSFFDSQGNNVLNATPQITLTHANSLFETFERTYDIPGDATSVELVLLMLNCTGGWDVRSIDLITR